MLVYVFFFKQKTAYEMRISDWSSDVCSSDLDFDSVNQGVFKRMRRGRKDGARVRLPFDDIMEFAIALLSISPQELEALRWTFADRKRLLDHLLASGRAAQGVDPERLGMLPIEISIQLGKASCRERVGT